MSLTVAVSMPAKDRAELMRWTRSPSVQAGLAQRARIVLLADEGVGTNEIVHRVGGVEADGDRVEEALRRRGRRRAGRPAQAWPARRCSMRSRSCSPRLRRRQRSLG